MGNEGRTPWRPEVVPRWQRHCVTTSVSTVSLHFCTASNPHIAEHSVCGWAPSFASLPPPCAGPAQPPLRRHRAGMRGPGVLLLACVACAATVIASGQRATPLRPADQLFSAVPLGQACAPASAIPTVGLNLTAEEQELLQFICWPEAGAEEAGERLVRGTRRGIPPSVDCKAVTWWVGASAGALRGVAGGGGSACPPQRACPPAGAARPHSTTHLPAHARTRRCDGDVCTEVCDAGSVAVEAWLHNAIKAQTRLARQLPFCYTTVLGTHNSGITLAAGCARVAGGCQCWAPATTPPRAAVAAGAGRLPPAPPCAAARPATAVLSHMPPCLANTNSKHKLLCRPENMGAGMATWTPTSRTFSSTLSGRCPTLAMPRCAPTTSG